jgi:hypothetical protein
MNREAIALAADSAVSFFEGEGKKIFQSANKIFTLSRYSPVGIMIYGNATLLRVHWETIIKMYRSKLGKKNFKTLKEFADDFIAYLKNNFTLFPESERAIFVEGCIYAYFRKIRDDINKAIEEKFEDNKKKLKGSEILQVVSTKINEDYKIWKNGNEIPDVNAAILQKLKSKISPKIEEFKLEIFEDFPLNQQLSKKLNEIALMLFSKYQDEILLSESSGVVIAGFGEEDFFPQVYSYSIAGLAYEHVVYDDNKEITIVDFDNRASIIPFAQSEMVYTFMSGIDPDYEDNIENFISEVINEYPKLIIENLVNLDQKEKKKLEKKYKRIGKKNFKEIVDKLDSFKKEYYSDPIMKVVGMLPKDELASMAESLVNLTSFKRKVSMQEETVGGPIDVAVISKGDGFIWIKRKHYFKPELNPQFFANYYREG